MMYSKLFEQIAIQLSLKGPLRHRSLGGGSINAAYLLEGVDQRVFVKVNNRRRFPGMFEAEWKGLDLLRKASEFTVPECRAIVNEGDDGALVMSYIESATQASDFNDLFAHALFNLHEKSNESFGLDHSNYIGSLPQNNEPHADWVEFLVSRRLEPQVRIAREQGLLTSRHVQLFEALYRQLESFFPIEKPSLLHGDLWSGNYMVDGKGQPAVIDPAVYFGHRYMDLGMMQLFGGFDRTIFQLYAEIADLDVEWRTGTQVANLYPLLVHVNLFGSGYVRQVEDVLNSVL